MNKKNTFFLYKHSGKSTHNENSRQEKPKKILAVGICSSDSCFNRNHTTSRHCSARLYRLVEICHLAFESLTCAANKHWNF